MDSVQRITFQDIEDQGVREQDGYYSVYDTIRICGHQWGHKVFSRLRDYYPSTIEKCHYQTFSGRGQRPTPVADKDTILEIIGLLPGAIGDRYRREAANLFRKYLEGDSSLTESLIDRTDDPEELNRLEKRIEGKKIRSNLMQELRNRGLKTKYQYGACTNALYQPLLGDKAPLIKQEKNLPDYCSLRDSMSAEELASVSFAEMAAQKKIKRNNYQGYKDCRYACTVAGYMVKDLMESI